uniref:SLH domain-containing protein n=1 Tax=uncultured Bacillota bacterium TaxID=344338 RepID=A0A650EQ43_9FIRM|nr:hypothetical protein Firmicute1046_1300 [uncultured Firmicutes bacterium]
MKKIGLLVRLMIIAVAAACGLSAIAAFRPNDGFAVRAEDEMRGVWISAVWNLDFPRTSTSDAESLRAELTAVMDNIQKMGFNTVFFQVRPSADALYDSAIFPWSKYLTGKQGTPPQDDFNPLEFAIAEAHRRGIALHAWVNPYRVTASQNDNENLAPNHPAVQHPDWVITHTDGKLYFDPGRPEVEQLILDGIQEIVDRYQVDGIHLDDYFYPGGEFADEASFAAYGTGYTDVGDWRRANIDRLIEKIHMITAQKSDIMFGVSPSGIWANKKTNPLGSDTDGKQSYYTACADSRGWVKKGYVDYLIPQVYWNIGQEIADFQVLTNWWADVAKGTNVKMYLGLAAYKNIDTTDSADVWFGDSGIQELRNQVALIKRTEGLGGYSMFAYNSFLKSSGLFQMMQQISTGTVGFEDMSNHSWAVEAVNALSAKGIVNGVSKTEFDPARQVNRADFTLMLTRLTGKTAEATDNFADVTADKYYYKEIGMAKALGIAAGRGDNLFDPTGIVSRQDMAVMAYRVLKSEGKINNTASAEVLNKFSDGAEVADYAREAVEAFVETGLLSGDGENLRPLSGATRAEAAVMLWRIDAMLNK